MVEVRRLTQPGIESFRSWLDDGAPDPVPNHLLDDPDLSAELPASVSIIRKPFGTRLEFGEYLVERLKPLPPAYLRFDAGLWDWLSLFYVEQLCPEKNGKRRPGEVIRYSLELQNRKWSRHLVRMSWLAVQTHGPHARVLLTRPMDSHGELLEQLAGQQETFGAPSIIEAADLLYWDRQSGSLKRGAQGKGPGTPRRLRQLMRQVRRTYDPQSMDGEQLLDLLPAEYDRWRNPATRKRQGLLGRLIQGSRREARQPGAGGSPADP